MTDYAVSIRRHYYTNHLGADNRELLVTDTTGAFSPLLCSSWEEAQVARDELSRDRELRHGEYATPTYRVVKVGTQRYKRLYRRTFGEECDVCHGDPQTCGCGDGTGNSDDELHHATGEGRC
jgi:hypothetical protein